MNIQAKLRDLFIPHGGNGFRPQFLQSNILLFAVLAVLTLKILTVAMYLPVSYNWFFADVTKTDLVNLLNQNRQFLGLNTLVESQKLNEAAYLKAQDMIVNGYFAHQSPQGTTPWFWFKKAGYEYKYAGENLAVGFVDSSTVYNAWSNSPSHKENLLNKNYTQVGTAVVTGFDGDSTLVVQLFGKPLAVADAPQIPIPKTQESKQTEVIAESPIPSTPITQNIENAGQTENTQPRVLAETTEYIVGPEYAGENSFYLRFLNFVVYDNNAILQYASLGLLAIVLACLAINGMLMFKAHNRVMLLRPVTLAVILGIAFFLNKEMISLLLPYQVVI